jgi:antitoxin YefM
MKPKFATRNMRSLSASEAGMKLDCLVNEVADRHTPVQIAGRRKNAVLVGEDDWQSMQETLHLSSIPKMNQSIRKGLKEPRSRLSKRPGW